MFIAVSLHLESSIQLAHLLRVCGMNVSMECFTVNFGFILETSGSQYYCSLDLFIPKNY